jgi:hypothetical protein
MKITLHPRHIFELEVDGKRLPGQWERVGQWEGFQKLRNDKGLELYLTDPHADYARNGLNFQELMGEVFGSKVSRSTTAPLCTVIKASLEIIALLNSTADADTATEGK